MNRDGIDMAIDGLMNDIAVSAAERNGTAQFEPAGHQDAEPYGDAGHQDAEPYGDAGHQDDAGYEYEDAAQAGEGFTVDDAASFLADVRDEWHNLDAADQEEASQAANELLTELGAEVSAQGGDEATFYEAFRQSGGDLHAAIAVGLGQVR